MKKVDECLEEVMETQYKVDRFFPWSWSVNHAQKPGSDVLRFYFDSGQLPKCSLGEYHLEFCKGGI